MAHATGNGLRKSELIVATVTLVLALLGLVVFAPAEAKPSPPEQVGPVNTQSEALHACKQYQEWPTMEMECRQAAYDTQWPEHADKTKYPR